jgi:carbonic anhydrase
MSNENINISMKNITGKCDLKCSYNFKYSESNSTAKNNGVNINLSYDSNNTPPVVYNSQKYNVAKIGIFSPSIHHFNGNTMPGELIITHNPVIGGNILEVCIPLTSSSESSSASNTLTEIISKVSTNAPSQGESTNLNISNFNLQNLVPKRPFFSYTNNSVDWIVFGALEAIALNSTTITTLQQIIKPFPIPTPGNELFYNSKGPSSGVQIGDGLYISCQPTGSSEEKIAVAYDKQSTSVDFSNIFQSPIFRTLILIIVGCILFVAVFYAIGAFFNYISSDSSLLPKLT